MPTLILLLSAGLAGAQHDQALSQAASSGPAATQAAAPTPPPNLTPDAAGSLSPQQIEQLIRVVADNDLENDKHLRDYTYIERADEHKLDGNGEVKSSEVKTFEVMELYGEQVQRLIEKNDKPLAAHDAAKEEEKIRKIIEKRKNESEDQRSKRLDKEEKEREQGREFEREVADAYNFRLAGTESLEGRDAWVIEAEPRPGYQPRMKDARILPKFRFRAWIDKKEAQWAKLDIQCIDTVSVGLLLVRLHPGSRIVIEQTRVNGEVWLPRHISVKIDARVALLKEYNFEQDQTFRDYKKFRARARILAVEDIQKK